MSMANFWSLWLFLAMSWLKNGGGMDVIFGNLVEILMLWSKFSITCECYKVVLSV